MVLMDSINSLLKTGNKTANIIVKMQFVHTVNGDGSKTSKIIKTDSTLWICSSTHFINVGLRSKRVIDKHIRIFSSVAGGTASRDCL